jgi:hypothetical protein
MRYAPYVGLVVIVALMWCFPSSRAQVGASDSDPRHVTTAPAVDTTAMRALTAAMAGYPHIGGDVEVGLSPNAAVPAPFNNATRKARGKLLAFDANWVGIQAREYDVKVWIPRENVGYVAEIPGTGNH